MEAIRLPVPRTRPGRPGTPALRPLSLRRKHPCYRNHGADPSNAVKRSFAFSLEPEPGSVPPAQGSRLPRPGSTRGSLASLCSGPQPVCREILGNSPEAPPCPRTGAKRTGGEARTDKHYVYTCDIKAVCPLDWAEGRPDARSLLNTILGAS